MKKRGLTLATKNSLFGWIFVSPFLIGFLTLMSYPFITSLRISFSKILKSTGISEMTFVGLSNYVKAFTEDVNFIPKLLSTISSTLIYTPLIVIFSLLIAIMINKKIKFKGFFRVVFFLPFMLGTGYVMSLLILMGVTGKSLSLNDSFFAAEQIQPLLGPKVTSLIVGFMNTISLILWKSGVQILLFLGGLQGISTSLYESAKCDSATEWEMFWKITLPMISPVMLLTCVYTVIDSFTDINNEIIQYFTYYAFTASQYEYASAICWIFFLFIILFLCVIFGVMRPFVFYAGEK